MKTNAIKKKLLFLLSCLVLLFCLTACSRKDTEALTKWYNSVLLPKIQRPITNTETLTKWYNSEDRTQIEQQINSLYKSEGLEFFITVEEPDTIVYNFQYDALSYFFDENSRDVLAAYLEQSMASAGPSLKSDIAQYQDIYELPVKVLRVAYLAPDGNIIYSLDIDENYEPSDDALTEQHNSLEEWVDSASKDSFVATINSSLEQVGQTIDFEADGDSLILIYQFTQQRDVSGYTQEEFEDIFSSSLSGSVASIQDNLEILLGFKISSMRIQIKNADNTLICDIPVSDLQDAR